MSSPPDDGNRWSLEDIRDEIARWTGETGRDPAAERRRLRIVRAATALFLRHGYRKTSVDEVARAAGIAKGTVYLYAKTKADLLVQAVVEEKRAWAVEIAEVMRADVPGRERLRRYVRGAILLGARMPLTSRLLRHDREILSVFEDMDPADRAAQDRARLDLTRGILRGAIAPGVLPEDELTARAQALLALLTAVMMADEPTGEGLSLERYAGSVADILVDGIVRVPGPTPGGTP